MGVKEKRKQVVNEIRDVTMEKLCPTAFICRHAGAMYTARSTISCWPDNVVYLSVCQWYV